MLCCHGVRRDESVDASVSLRLLLSRLLRCFSYLEVRRGEELYKDAGVIHLILKEQPTTFVLVCHGSAGKSSVGLVTKSAISS